MGLRGETFETKLFWKEINCHHHWHKSHMVERFNCPASTCILIQSSLLKAELCSFAFLAQHQNIHLHFWWFNWKGINVAWSNAFILYKHYLATRNNKVHAQNCEYLQFLMQNAKWEPWLSPEKCVSYGGWLSVCKARQKIETNLTNKLDSGLATPLLIFCRARGFVKRYNAQM